MNQFFRSIINHVFLLEIKTKISFWTANNISINNNIRMDNNFYNTNNRYSTYISEVF